MAITEQWANGFTNGYKAIDVYESSRIFEIKEFAKNIRTHSLVAKISKNLQKFIPKTRLPPHLPADG